MRKDYLAAEYYLLRLSSAFRPLSITVDIYQYREELILVYTTHTRARACIMYVQDVEKVPAGYLEKMTFSEEMFYTKVVVYKKH